MAQADCQNLDDYLATFYEGARLDSSGQFSLDLESRARKTAAFQLTQPELFVLPLLMAAWLGGARRFEVEPHPHGFDLVFDGLVCTSEELDLLQECLENRRPDPSQPRLRHLQVAMRLVRELNIDSIVLETPGQPGLAWMKSQLVRAPRGERQRLSLRLVTRPMAWLFGSRLIKIRESVKKVLEQRSYLSLSKQVALARLNIGHETDPGALGCMRPEDPNLRGHLALLDWNSPSEAWLVHHGVLFPIPAPRRQSRLPYRLLLEAPEATPDLSYSKLVEDETLQNLLRQLPVWLGELDWAYLLMKGASNDATSEICWDMRQRTLHGLNSARVDWSTDSGVLEAMQLGHGRTFAMAAQAYRQLRFLPICWRLDAPPTLGGGAPLVIKPTRNDEILDRVFPRQQEFLCWSGQPVPLQVRPLQMLIESEFVQISPVSEGMQLGLNRLPQSCPGAVWLYESIEGGRLQAAKALEPPAGLPIGVTIATTGPVQHWQAALLEALRLAWLDPRTERDVARHSLVLEHWLLAARVPSLRKHLSPSSAWVWNDEDQQVFLSDLQAGKTGNLRLNPALKQLLAVLWQ